MIRSRASPFRVANHRPPGPTIYLTSGGLLILSLWTVMRMRHLPTGGSLAPTPPQVDRHRPPNAAAVHFADPATYQDAHFLYGEQAFQGRRQTARPTPVHTAEMPAQHQTDLIEKKGGCRGGIAAEVENGEYVVTDVSGGQVVLPHDPSLLAPQTTRAHDPAPKPSNPLINSNPRLQLNQNISALSHTSSFNMPTPAA